MEDSRVISFANIKGGVGKSTLCILFANFCVKNNIPVQIIDCDPQKSIYKKREWELNRQKKKEVDPASDNGVGKLIPRYKIYDILLNEKTRPENLLPSLWAFEGVSIIDMPGTVPSEIMKTIFCASDAVVIPFKYENMVINSTADFLSILVDCISQSESQNTKVVFAPNFFDSRVGTKEEKVRNTAVTEAFSSFGSMLEPIPNRTALTRIVTFGAELDVQLHLVKNQFSTLFRMMDIPLKMEFYPDEEIIEDTNE